MTLPLLAFFFFDTITSGVGVAPLMRQYSSPRSPTTLIFIASISTSSPLPPRTKSNLNGAPSATSVVSPAFTSIGSIPP